MFYMFHYMAKLLITHALTILLLSSFVCAVKNLQIIQFSASRRATLSINLCQHNQAYMLCDRDRLYFSIAQYNFIKTAQLRCAIMQR